MDVNMAHRSSPNFNDRQPEGANVSILVLHHIAMNSFESAVDWLCDRKSKVSSHYIIGKDGEVVKLVDEDKRAWHAGRGSWNQVNDINSYSIGIELDNNGFQPFSNKLMKSLIELAKDIMTRCNISQYNIIAHSDLAPARKEDPNPFFSWKELKEYGVGLLPEVQKSDHVLFKPGSIGFLSVQTKLSYYGYNVSQTDIFDTSSQIIVTAFKRHFSTNDFILKHRHNQPYWEVNLNWTKYDDEMLNALYNLKQQGSNSHN